MTTAEKKRIEQQKRQSEALQRKYAGKSGRVKAIEEEVYNTEQVLKENR